MAANEMLCIALKRLSVTPDVWVIWVLFGLWFCRLRFWAAWGLDTTLLRGNPLAAELFFQYFSWHSVKPLTSPLHSTLVTLWWSCFFYLSVVTRSSSYSCSIVYSGWFLYNLVLIPDWSWEEISVASTYSSPILDPPLWSFWCIVVFSLLIFCWGF